MPRTDPFLLALVKLPADVKLRLLDHDGHRGYPSGFGFYRKG